MADHRATNITWDAGDLTRKERWGALGARGATVWFTGLSGSGKSTIAAALERQLVAAGTWAYRLDGDNVRFGLNRDLGFAAEDRAENIRRVGEVARLFADSGAVAIASFISPYARDRAAVRDNHDQAGLPFYEVFVDAPLAVCEQRDPKGLYRRARAGEISNFTGIDAPYEAPQQPALVLTTAQLELDSCVRQCMELLAAGAGGDKSGS